MASCSLFLVDAERAPLRFRSALDSLFNGKTFDAQCTSSKGTVNKQYAVRHMRSRATLVAWAGSDESSSSSPDCGFALGMIKRDSEHPVLYIDLVCSQQRQGGKLLAALEGYASHHGLASVAALRAATPGLLKVYERKGYRRQANACLPPSRANRLILRALDSNAGAVAGGHDIIFTDGKRVVTSMSDAWKLETGQRRDTPKYLPKGWHAEEGYHGWWMSKCL